MKVVWNAPSTDGGTPVVGYHVERRSKISRHWVFLNKDPVPDTSLVVKDLFEDMVYEYRVTAVNKMGAGRPSDPSLPITARNPWSQSVTYLLFMVALWNRADHYLFMLLFVFLLSPSFFFFFSSPNLSRHRLDDYHTSTHGVALVRI